MKRVLNVAIAVALGLRFHHHFHGPPVDYVGVAAAAAASWIGVPGPGEPVLIAGGMFAARHRLDITEVLLVAWAGAAAGGVAGWLIGMRAGRVVMTAPGPLRRARERAIERGDEIFTRVPVVAVLLTPSWIAGIHRVRARLFIPVNIASAALWAFGIGLGAFFAGPAVVDVVSDIGWVTAAGVVALVVAGVILEVRRRRRRRDRAGPTAASATSRRT
jgi:membrane protein DedA with SNARE-associated domain